MCLQTPTLNRNVRENLLVALPSTVFSGLTHLAYLTFRHNGITSIPDGLFAGLPSLSVV